MYQVLLHNDDYTTMNFVVELLMGVFHKTFEEATRIMFNVHRSGIGVCGIYTFEIAETKVETVHQLARESGFPLKSSLREGIKVKVMISKELSAVFSHAVKEARKRRHEYVCVEHILYAIIHDSSGIEIIESCGGNVGNIQNELEKFFNEKLERVPDEKEYVLQQTMRFQRVIQRAVNHARSAEKESVYIGDILASMLEEKNSHAAYFMAAEGITRLDVLNVISHGTPVRTLQGRTGRRNSAG